MKYTLFCPKCNTNLKDFNKTNSYFCCKCKPIIGTYNMCSGVFISFIINDYNFLKIEFSLSIDNEKDLLYRYHNYKKVEEFTISNYNYDYNFKYLINFNKNILDTIEEVFIIGNKFKQNLLFY